MIDLNPATLTMAAPPRISAEQFTRVLLRASSPAAIEGPERLYQICVQNALDPAVALAFFGHESTFGTKGAAVRTKNWGNIRKGQGRHIVNRNGWAYYANWTDGLIDWCSLINRLYIRSWKLTTVDLVLDRYAPREDHNNPNSYAAAVAGMVATWQLEDASHA